MKPNIVRQQRRPSKVQKPSAPTAPRGRPQRAGPAASHLEAHLHAHHLNQQVLADELKSDQDHSVFDPVGVQMGAEEYAAAAHAMDTDHLGSVDAHGDPEAEADMEDDTHSVGGPSVLPPHVDLSAANFTNGGPGVSGGGVPQGMSQGMSQVVHDQLHEMQQGLAQAQAQVHAQQHQQQQHAQQHQHAQQQQHQPQAQMGGLQPQMQQAHQLDPSLVKTTEEWARDSGYTGLNVESALAKRLAREPGLRLATQRRPEQTLNLNRRSNVEALFAHISGEPARMQCKNCHKGHGPWTSCVIVDGQMCGSCANCWFNASGARCSFHETRTQNINQHPNILPANNAAMAADPAYRFTANPHLLQSQVGQVGQVGQAHANAIGNVAFPGVMLPQTSMVQDVLNKAYNEVRQADKATRLLHQIQCTAKQLALQIVEYEELTGGAQEQHPGISGPGQQVMGDEGGA
ncbi:hypothetical protein QBC44DRAFT_364631 [Cladorrhinum sp. PSN332]|nr:hypothetical protein QBC44DRAFT_364631 [Cladorrhinum sp. PSN332]